MVVKQARRDVVIGQWSLVSGVYGAVWCCDRVRLHAVVDLSGVGSLFKELSS